MNEVDQRIAIAKACGWALEFNGDHEDPEWYWVPPDDPDGNDEPPEYPDDLNAMREAEMILNKEQRKEYARILNEEYGTGKTELADLFLIINAPASQRAKAFLKTTNLWVDP